MPTATQIIDKAFRLFDEETDSKYEQDGNRTTALDLLNDGYFDVCLETLCKRATTTIATIPNVNGVDFPEGFISIFEIEDTINERYLDPIFESDIQVGESDEPTGYCLTDTQFKFNVIPDSAYSYVVNYFTGPTAELTLDDPPSLVPTMWQMRVLPYYVLWKLFAIDKREEVSARAPFWENEYIVKRNTMRDYFAGEKRYAGRTPEVM